MNLKKLLDSMTVDEKIGQLTQYNANLFLNTGAEITGPQAKLAITEENLQTVGSVLNFKCAAEVRKIQEDHLKKDPRKIPMAFMMDVIHGYRTIYPIPLGLACSFDEALSEQCAHMAAKEASADGVQVTFAPMVDYVRDPRWGRVMETCGEEPLLTSRLASAQIRGFQGEDPAAPDRVATCVKHYAGYGGAEAGRDYNLVECSPRELYEYYLPAYKACIDAGAPLLMPSFNSLNGVPSVANPLLMQKILKDEWHFDGVVISDYNAIGELIKHGVAADKKEAAAMAFANNCDIEMCSSAYFHHLKALIEEGVFTEAQLDEAVLRVLRLKEKLGLFRDPLHGMDEKKAEALFLCSDHRKLALEAAAESAVLLKNDGLLPLKTSLKKVAVIGPMADNHGINGFWSCVGEDADTVTVAQGIADLLGSDRVVTAPGCGNLWDDTDSSGIPEAAALAKSADAVILCLGEPQNYSGEGNARTDLRLPGMQEALAKAVLEANPATAVVVFSGRPLVLTAIHEIAPAILEMWFPGTEGGTAAAELLFGKRNPCGKVAMTFPRSVGQCPIYYNHPNTGRPHWTAEPIHKGYASDYIDCATLPLYSFGHGLSYSRFLYGDLRLSARELAPGGEITVTVTVKNGSDIPGKEVVQLYMRDPVASVVRPVRQLIDFRKVAFAPREEKEISFTVTADTFRFRDMEGKLIAEKGEIDLMVGKADDFAATEKIRLI